MKRTHAWLFLALCLMGSRHSNARPISSDEQVLWLPALASENTNSWRVSLHGIVFEPETRPLLSWLGRKLMGISIEEMGDDERSIFKERTRWFLADNESGKRVSATIAGTDIQFERTTGSGHFSRDALLPADTCRHPDGSFDLPVVVARKGTNLTGVIHMCVVPAEGISVVSDIDDTIKATIVRDRKEMIRNTFLRPFRAVEGMAGVYQKWAEKPGTRFHYVSGSPWQLYPALHDFQTTNGFPSGTWHLRILRLTPGSVLDFTKTPDEHKRAHIDALAARFPQRQFLLVGDSGEHDPEIYGEAARRHPENVIQILIRDVTSEPASSPRYTKAFEGVPAGKWKLFTTAGELR